MAFRLTIQTDNAAFDSEDGDGVALETARILRETADKIEAGSREGLTRDANGNRVGAYTFEATL